MCRKIPLSFSRSSDTALSTDIRVSAQRTGTLLASGIACHTSGADGPSPPLTVAGEECTLERRVSTDARADSPSPERAHDGEPHRRARHADRLRGVWIWRSAPTSRRAGGECPPTSRECTTNGREHATAGHERSAGEHPFPAGHLPDDSAPLRLAPTRRSGTHLAEPADGRGAF
jgi:hypothetical protein